MFMTIKKLKLTFKEKDGEHNAHTKASYCKEKRN